MEGTLELLREAETLRCNGEMMTLNSTVGQEIMNLIQKHGLITFAQFMRACLYSPKGGFYSARSSSISAHFGTSPTMHPVFGALIARQLEQMWQIMGEPGVFHLIEVGSGDGSLAWSIMDACQRMTPRFAEALRYVAADYQPVPLQSPVHTLDWPNGFGDWAPSVRQDTTPGIQRVKAEGLRAFRNLAGCILCNELIDNFPVHRFCIRDGRVQEVYVTLAGGKLTEMLDKPSTPGIEERLATLALSLPEGYRGEVNLAMEDWINQVSASLDRGFVLTIDYGQSANSLYSPRNAQGTLVCHRRHAVGDDPYRDIGEQDITCQVDFTSLRMLGERYGLATVGYTTQTRFLANLGFHTFLDAQQPDGRSTARTELSRIAMMTLVDPSEYGDFKVLAQAKGNGLDSELLGFAKDAATPTR